MRWPTRYALLANTQPPGGGGGGGGDPTPDPTPLANGAVRGIQRHGKTPHQLFHPTASFINVPLPANVAIDDAVTPAVAAELVRTTPNTNRASLNITNWSMPTYTVPGDFTRVPIKIHGTLPDGTGCPNYQKAMQEVMFSPGIPVPPEHKPQGDRDDEAAIYCPDVDTLWEFWRLRPLLDASGNPTTIDVTWTFGDGTVRTFTCAWECTDMWQMPGVSTHTGRAGNRLQGAVYPHAPNTDAKRALYQDTNMSVLAAKLPGSALQLTLEDVQRGYVDHALFMSPITPLKTVRRWPASATDGSSSTSALVEGMRLRFPPDYIVPSTLHPLAQLCAQAIRDFGIVIADKSGAVEIDAEPEVAQFLNGATQSEVLLGFEWDKIQVLVEGSDAVINPLA